MRVVLPAPAGPVVELSVSDDGAGMSGDVVARAFEPFFSTKAPGSGTGMGLAVVHGAAVKAKAGLRVETHPNAGTTVTLSFPVASFAPTSPPAEPPTAPPTDTTRMRPPLVRPDGDPLVALVVDDDDSIRRMERVILERRGVRVVDAVNGKQALAHLLSTRVDVVVTDFLMPEMNGLELIAAMRTRNMDVPILLVSGFIGDPAVLAAVPAEVKRMQKPFSASGLVDAVVEVVAAARPS